MLKQNTEIRPTRRFRCFVLISIFVVLTEEDGEVRGTNSKTIKSMKKIIRTLYVKEGY